MEAGLLRGKSVVISGAGSGVGRAASLLFAEHGALVVCADINSLWLNETVALVTAAKGKAFGLRCDVSRRGDVLDAVSAAVSTYGRLDVMYNNAGIASPSSTKGRTIRFEENTDEQIDGLIAVNYLGVIHGCQAAIAHFRARGTGGGHHQHGVGGRPDGLGARPLWFDQGRNRQPYALPRDGSRPRWNQGQFCLPGINGNSLRARRQR